MSSLRLLAALVMVCACTAPSGYEADESDVKVATDSPLAVKQYKANLAFAKGYKPKCIQRGAKPRVLVTGFGRFLGNRDNATGQLVSRLLPSLKYPLTDPPPAGQI